MVDWQRAGSKARAAAREAGYHSAFEQSIGTQLREAGVAHVHHPDPLAYEVTHTYTPDFVVSGPIGGFFYIEVKGYFPPEERTKLLAVRRCNPSREIRIVFQNANTKLSRNGKTTYGDWATRNGFVWADGAVPEEWLR